jgi:arylsulfatase A-like enzyme
METHAAYNPPDNSQNILKINSARKKEISKIRWTDFYIRKDITPEETDLFTLLYEQELAYLDERISAVYEGLDRLGLSDSTMFIVTADHGEGFGEHNVWSHTFGLYNELTHIPLIVKYPSFVGLKGEEARVVQLHDIFATILDLLNCPLPLPMSSASMLDSPRAYAFAELADPSIHLDALKRADPDFHLDRQLMQACRSIVDRDLHKLIRWADGRQELYDLKKDYGELENRIDDPGLGGVREDLSSRLAEFPDLEA